MFLPPTGKKTTRLHLWQALTVKHIIKDCNALGELRQSHRVKGNPKDGLRNVQLSIDRTLPFRKAASAGSDRIHLRLRLCKFVFSLIRLYIGKKTSRAVFLVDESGL